MVRFSVRVLKKVKKNGSVSGFSKKKQRVENRYWNLCDSIHSKSGIFSYKKLEFLEFVGQVLTSDFHLEKRVLFCGSVISVKKVAVL